MCHPELWSLTCSPQTAQLARIRLSGIGFSRALSHCSLPLGPPLPRGWHLASIPGQSLVGLHFAICFENSLRRLFRKSHATCRSNTGLRAWLLQLQKQGGKKLRLNIAQKWGWHQTTDELIGCGEGSEKFTLFFPVIEGCWFCRGLLFFFFFF